MGQIYMLLGQPTCFWSDLHAFGQTCMLLGQSTLLHCCIVEQMILVSGHTGGETFNKKSLSARRRKVREISVSREATRFVLFKLFVTASERPYCENK